MKVLAIDPGYGRCGMAVLERAGSTDTLIYSVCLETSPKQDFSERLHVIVTEYKRLMGEHRPDSVAMEKLFFSANRKTAMRVAEVRGALISIAAEAAIPVHEYSPGEIKSAAAGFGGAGKAQVATMLHMLLKIPQPIHYDDEYDAIAVGVTHLARSQNEAVRR